MPKPEQPEGWMPRLPRTWSSLDTLDPTPPVEAESSDDTRVIGARETSPNYTHHIPPYLLEPVTNEGEN
jgi:hypothetical protein